MHAPSTEDTQAEPPAAPRAREQPAEAREQPTEARDARARDAAQHAAFAALSASATDEATARTMWLDETTRQLLLRFAAGRAGSASV